jgi:hypothetical protein
MYIGIDHSGFLKKDKVLTQFILEKENKELPEKYQIYIYSTISDKKRMYGIQWNNFNGRVNTYSIITFNPFGYFLAVDSAPPIDSMTNITNFKKYDFNESKGFLIPLIFLKTDKMLLG